MRGHNSLVFYTVAVHALSTGPAAPNRANPARAGPIIINFGPRLYKSTFLTLPRAKLRP